MEAESPEDSALCVLIETCQKELDGKDFGEWGNTALEASALGTICVTNSTHQHAYQREYGDHALFIANDKRMLEAGLKDLLWAPDDKIMQWKKEARKWVREKHGIEATAQRLWDKVYSHYFAETRKPRIHRDVIPPD